MIIISQFYNFTNFTMHTNTFMLSRRTTTLTIRTPNHRTKWARHTAGHRQRQDEGATVNYLDDDNISDELFSGKSFGVTTNFDAAGSFDLSRSTIDAIDHQATNQLRTRTVAT